MTSRWSVDDIGDLTGRTAVVTGTTSGLGLHTAAQLARHGAAVTAAVRDLDRGRAAVDQMVALGAPRDGVGLARLDLADLGSVRAFAAQWPAEHPGGLDLLVNNAGVMAIPRRTSADGFELQLATNHLGPFALTAGLMPALLERAGARVVTVSSNAHRMGRIRFDDLMGSRRYRKWAAYGQSKLANLLFTFELQRRLDRAGAAVGAMAAHPGWAATELQAAGPRMSGSRVGLALARGMNAVVAQPAAAGALPTLFAATRPGLPGGSYAGPGGFGEVRGHPRLVRANAAAYDEAVARRLWDASCELTGAVWPLRADGG